jgi:galactosylceramidase
LIEKTGAAGVMGRVNATGRGYGCQPNAYYMTLSTNGASELYIVTEDRNVKPKLLASAKLANIYTNKWHKMSLQFSGATIKGLVDNVTVLQASDTTFLRGMAGLLTTDESPGRTTAQFDNFIIRPIGAAVPRARRIAKGVLPIYTKQKVL